MRLDWGPIVDEAASWVQQQTYAVTLRQVFYHLVAEQWIPNNDTTYKGLSARTAAARREDLFPGLADGTREILVAEAYTDLSAYTNIAARRFTLDRTRGQDYQIVVGVEKRGMSTAVWQQFGARGFSVVAMGGYSSATIDMDIAERLAEDGRMSVLLYAGDFDCTGEDIYRNLTEQVDFDIAIQVALTEDQVEEYDLPVNPGKSSDTRASGFAARHGTNVQVEVDALPPATLADLFDDAAADYWDKSVFDEVVAEEAVMRDAIRDALEGIGRA